jgi:4-amino-4-deoxy-L-arabinose transferase-like glycosyltransferase
MRAPATGGGAPAPGLRSLQAIGWAKIFWLVTFAALAWLFLSFPRSPLPWLDESFFASASLSVVRGGPAIPTVLGAFPHTTRFDLFYGPLYFFLGALDLRLFGLSLIGWRLLGVLGGVGAIFSAAWVSRRLDGSTVATASSAMFVAMSQGMGARATCGRLDTITITLELLCVACTLGAMRGRRSSFSFVQASLAGLFCGLAGLSTPRSFPFVLGIFAAIALELALARSWGLVARGLTIGGAALLPVWGWTFSQGMTPVGWFRFILTASQGDKLSVSPMLHGNWHLLDEPLMPLLSGLLFFLLMLLVFGAMMLTARRTIETGGRDFILGVRLASITVLINYAATFLTIARFWDYELFVIPLVLPILVALTAKVLRNSGPVSVQRAVLCGWLMLALVLGAIRSGKVVAWAASYGERDPKPLQSFVDDKVAKDSLVFGPDDLYFYAVEAAGSHYRFVRAISPSGLVTTLNETPDWRAQLGRGPDVYLIWPSDVSLPRSLESETLRLEGSFAVKSEKGRVWWRRAGWGSGYPATNLYRILGGPADEKSVAKWASQTAWFIPSASEVRRNGALPRTPSRRAWGRVRAW